MAADVDVGKLEVVGDTAVVELVVYLGDGLMKLDGLVDGWNW